MPCTSRQDVLKLAKSCGWTYGGDSGKGYTKLLCGCGKHLKWVHKTPSDPHYWQNTCKKISRDCCPGRPGRN